LVVLTLLKTLSQALDGSGLVASRREWGFKIEHNENLCQPLDLVNCLPATCSIALCPIPTASRLPAILKVGIVAFWFF